jgi:hypothetical protein
MISYLLQSNVDNTQFVVVSFGPSKLQSGISSAFLAIIRFSRRQSRNLTGFRARDAESDQPDRIALLRHFVAVPFHPPGRVGSIVSDVGDIIHLEPAGCQKLSFVWLASQPDPSYSVGYELCR